MGGRPWQSKGCRVCRRRKIKCDGQQPACGKCIKRGIECPGYQKPHIFNVYQETFRQGIKMSPHQLIRHSNQELDSLILRRPSRVVTPIIAIDAASINRDQIFSVFLDNYFPTVYSGSPHGVELWHSLVEGFFLLPKKTHMLDTAITALSCVYLGKIKNDGRVFGHGLQLYTQAIQDMSSMICQNIYTDDIICTSVIFQEIENCHCPQGFQTWLAHVAGTNAIMKHHQYIKSTNPIVDAIYDQWQKFRIICLTMGRDLNEEEYEYCREPSEGRPLVELINIFAKFTPLSADIESVGQSNHEACQTLLGACLAQKSSLLEWYARRKATFGGGPLNSTNEFRCIDVEPVDVIFGRPYSFSSLDDALLHVLYCTSMAIVLPMVSRARTLVQSLNHGEECVNYHSSDEEYPTMQTYADQIIRSVPFFVQEKNKLLGPHMVMFGVAAACKAYINLGIFEKFDWCQKTLGSFGDRGFESCHNYRQYAWDYWNSGDSHIADPFLPISVRGDELKSASPSLNSEDQPNDTSDCGKSPFSNCVEWEFIGKEGGSFMLDPSLLDDSWQKWAMCCVSTQ